jgi:peptidoglycan/LPS O-acetylase OafA/YrhL
MRGGMTADTEAERESSARPHLGGVESLRAYAALAVVVFHVIHLARFDPPASIEFLKWHLGRGVPLFFVVSAFSLAYGYVGRLSEGRQVAEFHLRRFFRIAPLYYAAILAQLAINYPHAWVFSHPLELGLSLSFVFNLSPQHVEGIALASWSIGVEMLFYLMLPFILLVVRGAVSALLFTLATFVGAAVWAVALAEPGGGLPAIVQHGLVFNLPYFGCGLTAFFLWREERLENWGRLMLFALAGMALLVWAAAPFGMQIARPLGSAVYQSLWGVPFAALCLCLARRDLAPWSWSATRFLGRISFSLYLVHPHVIDWLGRLGLYQKVAGLPLGSGVHFPTAVLLTLMALVPLAWITYRLVEVPGIALGRRLVGRLRRPPAAQLVAT